MVMTKVTWLFHASRFNPNVGLVPAATRISAWSESWYKSGNLPTSQGFYTEIFDWARARAKLLGKGQNIIGYRAAEVGPSGRSYAAKISFAGKDTNLCDNPEQCLVASLGTADSKNRRIVTLRGLPDERGKYGEYLQEPGYDRDLRAFMDLVSTNWFFRGKTHAVAAVEIQGISEAGVITTKTPHGIAATQEVQIYRTNTPEKRQAGVKSVIATRVTDTTLSTPLLGAVPLILDKLPLPTTGGQLRRVEGYSAVAIAPGLDWLTQLQTATRDTGSSPFFGRRGRQSAKRR